MLESLGRSCLVFNGEAVRTLLIAGSGILAECRPHNGVCPGAAGPEEGAVLEGLGCAAFDGEFVVGGPAEPAVLPAVGAPVLLDDSCGEPGSGA